MNRLILSFLLFLGGVTISVAQVGISTDGSIPDASALLDLKSSDKGLLLPRMTSMQRDAISNPAEGLMVYCTDCGINGSVSVFSNNAWRLFCPSPFSSTPTAGTNSVIPGQIVWRWNAVAGAIGYKWNTTNDYSTATDMGTSLFKIETGITCGTSYTRYVWAYNACSYSSYDPLTETISATAPAAPAAGTHVSTKTQITWNWNTVSGATGYKWSNVNDFATATDMGLVTTKVEDTLACDNSYTRYVWAYNGCGYSTNVTLTQSTLDCFICGVEYLTINHVTSGGVAPVNKWAYYGTATGIPGETSKCWITSNLGASQPAYSVSDNTEASAGWYWQFNRKQGYKHDGITRTPGTTWISPINENSNWITANDPCTIELGTGWRIPTYTEWYNVDNTGDWTNWNGPWESSLKMHTAGYLRYDNGLLNSRGTNGRFWSSTQESNTVGWDLDFGSGYCTNSGFDKAYGFSLRCLRD